MDNIDKVFDLTKELIASGLIPADFLPTDEKAQTNLLNDLYPKFSQYLDNILSIWKTKRYFDIRNPQIKPNETLVIEIGGTKTTIQKIRIVKDIKFEIIPISTEDTVETIKSQEIIGRAEFFDWIFEIIDKYIHPLTSLALNLPTAISANGEIIFSPPNLNVEDLKGVNVIDEVSKEFSEIDITVFNDTESVMALQCLREKIPNANLYIDINGTGNNSSCYTKEKVIQSLESGHAKCFSEEGADIELENIVGGHKGIERIFNKILEKNNITNHIYSAFNITTLYEQKDETELHKIAVLTFNKMFLYKTISFILIDRYCKEKQLIDQEKSEFILFGGINKQDNTQKGIKSYLDFYKSNINISYTTFGESAGRYGAAILANQDKTL